MDARDLCDRVIACLAVIVLLAGCTGGAAVSPGAPTKAAPASLAAPPAASVALPTIQPGASVHAIPGGGTAAQQFETSHSRFMSTVKSLDMTAADWPSQQQVLSKLADALHDFRVDLEAISFPASVTDSKALIYWSNMYEAILRQIAASPSPEAANSYSPQYRRSPT